MVFRNIVCLFAKLKKVKDITIELIGVTDEGKEKELVAVIEPFENHQLQVEKPILKAFFSNQRIFTSSDLSVALCKQIWTLTLKHTLGLAKAKATV